MFSHRGAKKILAGHLGLDPMERNPPWKDLVVGEADRRQNMQRPKPGIPVASVFKNRERRCLDSQGVRAR